MDQAMRRRSASSSPALAASTSRPTSVVSRDSTAILHQIGSGSRRLVTKTARGWCGRRVFLFCLRKIRSRFGNQRPPRASNLAKTGNERRLCHVENNVSSGAGRGTDGDVGDEGCGGGAAHLAWFPFYNERPGG